VNEYDAGFELQRHRKLLSLDAARAGLIRCAYDVPNQIS